MQTITLMTRERECLVDITAQIKALIANQGWSSGGLILFCPHTTCGLTINEGADPDVARDITAFMRRLVPAEAAFRHAEGNSDAHVKASLFGASLHVIVERGALCLGTWQAIYLYEGDGPRSRNIWAQWLPGAVGQ